MKTKNIINKWKVLAKNTFFVIFGHNAILEEAENMYVYLLFLIAQINSFSSLQSLPLQVSSLLTEMQFSSSAIPSGCPSSQNTKSMGLPSRA